jgi:carboxyl-terminal processing protease
MNTLSKFFLLSVLLFPSALAFSETPSPDVSETASDQAGALPLRDLQHFTQVFDQIRKAYVEEVDDTTLFRNAIIGMLSQLDPHSTYLDEVAFEELQTNTQGEFGGLGIEVGMEDGFVKVISPIDGTPAKRAGVLAGDLIIKLDGSPINGMTLNQAVDKMRGKKGTSIDLTIVREGEDKPIELTIVRDMIKVASVRLEKLDDHFVYTRIAQFQ